MTAGAFGDIAVSCPGPCKDPRIVSHRRSGFFAAVARTHGETADRMIASDPDWRLPLLVA